MREKTGEMRNFCLKCVLVLIFGILGINSGTDPYFNQPRLVVQDGNLAIRGGHNRNVNISTNGEGRLYLNNANTNNLGLGGGSGMPGSTSLSSVNRRVAQILNAYQSLVELTDKVNQIEENVTAINQRLNLFVGADQNRITNRGMRRYFAKVKMLEDKVNHLTELLSTNECANNPCRNGGTCVDSYNGYVCNCPSNWEGPTCESDVNECALYAGTAFGCQNGATCTNLPGSYRCDCATNWFGIHCTEQHDDCTAASHQELCGHGTCVNEKRIQPGQPKYRCICEPGWTTAANSPACSQDVDECSGSQPKCSVNPRVLCFNLPGTFHCGPCPVGYTGNGLWCEDINECENNNGGCSINPFVECYNTPGSRRCGPCPNGYFGNGEQCMYQSVCNNNRGGCHPLATCIDNPAITATYRECRCPPGYVGNGEGLTGCAPTQGMTCDRNPCQHGTCQMVGNSYRCTCNAGYYGTNCEMAEDPCRVNPCLNGGTCVRQSGTFTCTCATGYSGPTCTEQRRDCGGYLSGNNGTLHYPEYSTHYDHQENCAWVITVQSDKVINITFDHFHLEGGYNCEYDFLQLNDGAHAGSRVIGRFCSDSLHGNTYTSTHNQVYLWFRSDRSVSATGFTVTWTAVDPVCGGTLNETEYGSVRSPGYPGVYPLNRTCSWLVQVPLGKRIQFSFATFMLETHENCSYDYVKILDGASENDPVIGTYCSTITPPPLITSGHAATVLFHSDYSQQDSGFNIAYSAIPGMDGCGGTLTAPQGVLTSPQFPASHGDNVQCEWLIRIRPNSRVKISFEEFQIESHRDCLFDWLEIYDGPSDASGLLGRFCGDTAPPDILSNSHQVYIRFRADMSVSQKGFKLQYKTICGGVFSELTGVLMSPNYPERYAAHTFCVYEIHLPSGYLVNLTIHDVEIESHVDCKWDYLEVRDGDVEESPLLSRLCGSTKPAQSIVSTYNKLWTKFETDGSVQTRGFKAVYEAIEIGCGGIHTNDNGTISSPRHPTSYPHNISCTWLIRAPDTHIIRLTFTSFRLESSGACSFDYVLVEDTDGVRIGKYCGNTIPPVITSIDNTLLLKFMADESVAFEGFTANYQFLDAREACGGDFYQTSGVIKSPGYPGLYPHLANCVWILHAPNGRQIVLNITDFRTEHHANCKYDYLEIRNGGYKTSPLIGKFCGNQIMSNIRSHSNRLRLEFKSDKSMSETGFQISFDSTVVGCGGQLTASKGSIVSPNYPQPYPVNADCEWLIRVSEGSVVSISVVEIDIEEHSICQYDYLQIYDGATENSKTLIKLCNNQQNPGAIVSTTNTVLVRFRSDFSEEAGGFNLVYQSLCNSVLKKRRGVIESPNFPNSYPHNHNCSWTIEAPMGNNISISFSHIFIEGTANCTLDYVEVLQVSVDPIDPVSLGKFCGDMTSPPDTITTSTNKAIVRLITDRSVSREGFRLEWTFVGCGGDIIDRPYGTITSPNYPNGYSTRTVCQWHIWYPPGNSVQFTLVDLDMESEADCRFDFIKVYGGENEESPMILNACHSQTNATTITSHGNQIFVVMHSDITITHRGFKATYKKLPTGCGGRFTAEEATILSPKFPDPYDIDDDCEWLIEVPSSNLVMIEFYDFEMPQAINCTLGHVAIYDGPNSSTPVLLKECGTNKPEGFISATGNQMLVKLVTDGLNVAKGFRAHYKTGCGRRLLADSGGEITSLGYPVVSRFDVNCSWIISASQIGEKVSLTVTHLSVISYNNCSRYSLQIFDGDLEDSPLIGKYCGRHLPPPIVSRGSTLRIFLQHGGSFRATYGLLSEHCGGTFTGASGSFASPGFPMNYDIEMECVWTIEASPGSKAHISFQSFHLESSSYCNTDYLEIHENDAAGPLIGKYCGNDIPSNVTSASKLWIKFRSDDIGTAPGFMAHYEIEHGMTLTGLSGEIASPGYPAKFVHEDNYEWTVIVPDKMFVSVQFTELEIPAYGDSRDCSGYVKIYDGFDEDAPDLGEYCGYTLPEPIFSTGNTITILFQGNVHASSRFFLRWSAANETGVQVNEDNRCLEEHILNATSTAVIQTPGHPQSYPNSYNCTYILRTLPTHHIDLQFEAFELEGSYPSCNFDKLESYYAPNPYVDSWILNSTLCGRVDDVHLSSPNNLMKLEFSTDRWVSLPGFKGTAKSVCGGQIFGNGGVLRSSSVYPNLQNVSGFGSFQCEWVISVRERRTIQLTFENFNIESDAICSDNYLLIRNGGFPTSPVLGNGKYCGSSLPSVPETSSNQVYVQLAYKPASGRSPLFDLRYNVVTLSCGDHIYLSPDIPYAEISSPNYPSPPTHDAECIWIIVSPSATRMRVDFETEFHLGPNCYHGENVEYLDIHDGGTENAPVLKRYCGHDQPSSAVSTGNALFVHYVTSSNNRQAGFKATVKIAHCGGTVSARYTTIRSPDFPMNYGSSIECEWFLKMKAGYHMILTLTEFETPTANNCSLTDYLEIRNRDAEGEVLDTFCGSPSNLPVVIDIPGPEAYLKFKSNSAVTGKGFSMIMEANYDEGCGAVMQDPSGVITSPQYPNALPHFRHCFWKITAPPGRRVKAIIEEINLPKDENLNTCTSYVSVFNFTHRHVAKQSDYKHQYCGTVPPPELDSASSGLYIDFNTRGLTAGQGFKLSYSTEEESFCGGILSGTSGVFASPNFTVQEDTSIDCLWRKDILDNQTLVVTFDNFDLPGNVANICRDYMLLAFTEKRFLGGYCGNLTRFIFTSPFLATHFRLLAKLDRPLGGFRGTYNVSNCGGVLSGSNAVITSPGYPNNYPPGTDCDWFIEVPDGEVVKISFIDLQLEEDCMKDYVLIRNGRSDQSPILGKFCGSQTIAPLSTTSRFVTIVFHSDEFGAAKGFKIVTTEVQRGCGGLIYMKDGNISSPNYPSRYDNNVECVWTIEQTSGYLVKVQFMGRFDIEQDASCSKDYIQLEEKGDDNTWNVKQKICGSVNPGPLISKGNNLRIIFHTNDRITGDGFLLAYSAECGGHFTQPSGDILSPNYPGYYVNSLNCTYVIGKSGDYISLTFDDYFSIEAHDTCIFDYVEIYQRNVSESNKQGAFCGTTPPASRTLRGPVTVRFVSDYMYVAHGFKLHYEILNCGAVFTSPTGVISTPSTTGGYINEMDCTWRIIGQANKVIQLRFLHFDVESSYGCWSDYLEVFDGNETGPSMGKFCGEGVQNVKSTGNELTLRFRSNHMVTAKGFAAYYYNTYGPDQGCGGSLNVTSGEFGSLDSDSDGFYEPNLDCGWLIYVGRSDQMIKITFNSFDLQMPFNGSCEYDYVEVREYHYDGPVVGRYCGNTLPRPIMTNANQVFVHFHSDDTENKSGFRLKFEVIPSSCGTSELISSSEVKTLQSPNYPNAYPPNLRCKWFIRVNYSSASAPARLIEVSITDIDIPCGGDYLEVKRARSPFRTPTLDTVRYCGNNATQIVNFRNSLNVAFSSDAVSNGGRGFSLTYKDADCNSSYTADYGSIIGPSSRRSNAHTLCLMHVTATSGRTIALYFSQVSIMGAQDCSLSYMKIYDGNSDTSPLLASYCGSISPNPVFSTSSEMFIKIFLQHGVGVYRMNYLTTDKGRGCGGSITASEGTLTSPLYPQPYNKTGECFWNIAVPGYHTVVLDITSFALSSTAGCSTNYLEIYEGSTADLSSKIVRYCGQDSPSRRRQLRSNAAVIKLVTDTTNDQSGFYLNFYSSDHVPEDAATNFVQTFDTS